MLDTDCQVTEFNSYESTTHSYHSSETNELEKLIRIVKKGIKEDEPGIKYIEHPQLLVNALEELNNMIGMKRLKQSIALQTVELIERMKSGEKNMAMLNAMLSGPPGVGKTKASTVLAKIWHALGFLSRNTVKTTTWKQSFFEGNKGSNESILPWIIFIVALVGSYVLQFISFVRGQLGWAGLFFVFSIVLLVGFLLWYYGDSIVEHYTQYTKEETKETGGSLITVVSRNDFVGEYMGHTSGKTKKLLEANTGKVLLIDEAYSLINGVNDNYGFECLNTLNLYLSENPDKIVVIFAGYRDQLKSTIFAAQPGLERRIMWRFQCDPYNGEELANIFLSQARQDGWEISKKDSYEIKKLISRNIKSFPAYGGDTERLVYLSGLQASQSELNVSSKLFQQTESKARVKRLTKSHVVAALRTLQENQFS